MIRILQQYLLPFVLALALTLVLTPLVRALHRRLGMVDEPSARRINKTPIPRGGGVAVFLSVVIAATLDIALIQHASVFRSLSTAATAWLVALATALLAIGLADDRWSLPPKAKLAGQVLVAVLVRAGAGIGFGRVFPGIPVVLDYLMTVFWIVGAINAFNLIDGLDGLATGLALIAVVGMGGALVFSGHTAMVGFYLVFAGALAGFLVYNYNPASIFLGDSGSMFIGFVLAVMPLCTGTADSLVVSIGVPMLAMGVPIFDTSLAILRRMLRRLLSRDSAAGRVMVADVDHLHHRILRSVGFSQRRAAWALYGIALVLVAIGLLSAGFRARAAGLWLVAVTVGGFVVFKNLTRIELYDAGRILSAAAHDQTPAVRRRWARLAVPFYLFADLFGMFLAFLGVSILLNFPITRHGLLRELPVMATATVLALVAFRTYRTVWTRAVVSNYLRLFIGTFLGAAVGTAVLYSFVADGEHFFLLFCFVYGMFSFFAFAAVRLLRGVVRDLFYALDCARLVPRKDVSRLLVYGAGLRYRTFRRELVRTTAANDRIIVGLLDDDILLKGHYIGGIRIWGTLLDAPEVVNHLNADTVVVCCKVSPDWMKIVRETLAPTGVKVTYFNFEETEMETDGI